VRDSSLALLLADYETAGNSLARTCYLPSQHAEVESQGVHELQSVLEWKKAMRQRFAIFTLR
jgi:hypothetical protein